MASNKEWNVFVDGIGHIGTVVETTEELARCSARTKFHMDGERSNGAKKFAIYEDDEFSVSPRQ